jgi:uncharacterized protein
LAVFARLALEPTDENLELMREYWPTAYFGEMQPARCRASMRRHFFAYPQIVFTHAGVDDDTVYQLTKALYEGKEALVAGFPGFGAFQPDGMAGDIGIAEFHPGALRFFEEAGLLNE